MVTRMIGKEDLNAATVPYNSYKLNAQAYSTINKVSNVKDKDFGGMHQGLPLSKSNVSIHDTWRLWTSGPLLYLHRLNFRLRLYVIYLYMQKMAKIKIVQCMGCKVQYNA
jgi:hypothetical protein